MSASDLSCRYADALVGCPLLITPSGRSAKAVSVAEDQAIFGL